MLVATYIECESDEGIGEEVDWGELYSVQDCERHRGLSGHRTLLLAWLSYAIGSLHNHSTIDAEVQPQDMPEKGHLCLRMNSRYQVHCITSLLIRSVSKRGTSHRASSFGLRGLIKLDDAVEVIDDVCACRDARGCVILPHAPADR